MPRGSQRRSNIGLCSGDLPRTRVGENNYFGSDTDAAVKIFHVLVAQTDAATRHVLADRARIVGAVDAVIGVAQIHGASAERIARTAADPARQIRLTGDHFGWRRPIRPFGLAGDSFNA